MTWRRQLATYNINRDRAGERALSGEQQRAQVSAELELLTKAAGRDLRALNAMAQQPHIDPRVARELHQRAQKDIAAIVRILDSDVDDELTVNDAVTWAAVQRVLAQRSRWSAEIADER
jgi:hypothetical protein